MTNTALLVASESLPVVDIDNTVFLQGILFLGLFVVLHFLLFKPWLEVKERRAAKIGGAFTEADELRARANAAEAEYEERLAKVHDEALGIRSDRRRDAEAEEAEIVGAARREAMEGLDARKLEIAEAAEQARRELGARVENLANDITKKILGRTA